MKTKDGDTEFKGLIGTVLGEHMGLGFLGYFGPSPIPQQY